MSKPFETHGDIDHLASSTTSLVADLINESNRTRNRRDQANRKRFARLLEDPAAIALTMSLTDEVMRMSSMKHAARTLRRSAKIASRSGLGTFDYVGIKAASLVSYLLPTLVMKLVHKRVRMAANGIILPAENSPLSRHINRRNDEEARLNINVLGEAVLGEHEAKQRLASVIEMIQRPEVNYASVKISSIASQLVTIDYLGSIERVSERLRNLYRESMRTNTFINLDMEEFRDLEITVAVFKKLLSEPEFERLSAGIVLQAYLPESHSVFAELVEWAKDRFEKNGGSVKIRLVKGANLAMEKAEAELHGWVPAPYESKSDVDASYARLIDVALDPEHSKAVRIGIASHNLFHLAWAIEVGKVRGVLDQIDIEMLEGMANAEALAVAAQTGSVLLYTPVTRHDDFPAAVAYLVRRLDENTSTENYLRASFDMEVNNEKYREQEKRFLDAVSERHTISTESRRHLLIREDSAKSFDGGRFLNQSDGDPTNPKFRTSLQSAFVEKYIDFDLRIPLQINGEEIFRTEKEEGIDPSEDGKPWYTYSIATKDDIDRAVSTAHTSGAQWESLGAQERARILGDAAKIMESGRAETIALMSRDSGKTVSEADPEVSEAIDFARYYALSALHRFEGSTPLEVVLVVPPWNFPYAIPMGGVCAALASGNAVILKPAPETVAVAWQIVNQLWSAGVPREVLQFVTTRDDEDGKHLVTHEGVNGVILTGAFDTAALFTSWKPEIRLMAETSGKNAILLSASADIDSAVKDLVQSAFGHAGQKCSAASLAIVERSIYENPSFLAQLKDAVESLTVGAGRNYSTAVGPVIHPPTGSLLRALTTLDDGESWLVQPKQLDEGGYLWSPGVKLGVAPGSWSHQSEWFGPVLGVMAAPDFSTALLWQNSVHYGLTAGVHSLDEEECEEWIATVEAGNLYVNRGITGAVVNRQPFGGWKRSSVGPTSKAGGTNYLNNLRSWEILTSSTEAISTSKRWWDSIGQNAIDATGLKVERNYQRYLPSRRGILVRIDNNVSKEWIEYITWVIHESSTSVEWSAATFIENYPSARIESEEDLLARDLALDKVRWLSATTPPTLALLNQGTSVDSRPLAQNGAVEMPRWLLEQSVSITNHRYGNVGAGPRPQLPHSF
ncbi:MAG: bifunctional proline dehydrogenase/L-glutamate gamma-semialdehyde dehydrogenase [Actinobacteria bacterium]|nr:bifunctional proline dehydrogenase/L-glutamate gamma-semialdehyde dehydrogenase [Actinomycetota bacterium]